MMVDRKQIIRDVPFMMWVIGLFTIGFGIYGFITDFLPLLPGLIVMAVGLAMFLITSILTVYVDPSRRVLEIERLSVLGRKTIEVQISKIQSIYVDRKVGTDSDGDRSVTYQVVLILDDGERIPLRKSYSSAKRKHERFAEIIRQETGLDHVDHAPESLGEMLAMAMQPVPADSQEAATGIAPGEHESNGVRWQLESFHLGSQAEGSTIHRWSSTDVDTGNDFVYITQKMEGQGQQRALMKLAGKFLFKTSLQMYGFDEFYAPGFEKAQTVENVDRRLVENFFIFASDPALARQLLNPWMVAPLINWSERYELQPGEKKMNQLSVLFSPLGVFVSQLGRLDRAEVDELVGLGVELVRAKQ